MGIQLTIRTEEQKLWLPIEIDDGLFDTRSLARDEKVDNRLKDTCVIHLFLLMMPNAAHIDVFLKASLRGCSQANLCK